MRQQSRCWFGHPIETLPSGRRRCRYCQRRYRLRYSERHPEEKINDRQRSGSSNYAKMAARYIAAWEDQC